MKKTPHLSLLLALMALAACPEGAKTLWHRQASGGNTQQDTTLRETEAVPPEWTDININENLVAPPIDSNDYFYPWYIIPLDDGTFENTLGDKITQKDTTKIYPRSYCYTFFKGDTLSRLPFSKTTQKKDSVFIQLYDESASGYESLELTLLDFKKFTAQYNVNFVVPYDTVTINFLQTTLEINKNKYKKGENLVGKVDLELEQKIYSGSKGLPAVRSMTKRLYGIFEVKIE